jgi:hypothetical protein
LSAFRTIVPGADFEALRPALLERLTRIGSEIRAADINSVFDALMRDVLDQGFAQVGAHEGTVWLLDDSGENLAPALNTGPDAHRLTDFKQPLNAGLISMVFSSEQSFLENEVWKNSKQSKLLDTLLGKQTCAMIAVPFCFLHACRGVISCVQLKSAGSTEPEPTGFRSEHLVSIQRTADFLARLIEARVIRQIIGLNPQ